MTIQFILRSAALNRADDFIYSDLQCSLSTIFLGVLLVSSEVKSNFRFMVDVSRVDRFLRIRGVANLESFVPHSLLSIIFHVFNTRSLLDNRWLHASLKAAKEV